jgi:subtilisin-like proprotein convertase family protein
VIVWNLRRAWALATLCFALLAPSAGAAGLDHVTATATGPGGRALIAPGDTIAIDETLRNSGATTLGGLVGTLSVAHAGEATVLSDRASFLALAPGASGTNTTPFAARISSGVACGANVDFALDVTGDAQANIGFSVGTGQPGPAQTHQTLDAPLDVPDTAFAVSSTVDVAAPGRVKALSVHIDHLYHPRGADMRLVLIGPDGTRVTLLSPNRVSGADFADTVFSLSGPLIDGSAAPHTGTYRAAGLAAFVGSSQQGLWKLELTDAVGGASGGRLDGWSLDVNPPVCDPVAQASFTVAPNPAPAGTVVAFDAGGSLDPDHKLDHYHWDFGDGAMQDTAGPTTTHSYATRGRRTATLTMKDAGGVTLSTASLAVFADQSPQAALAATPAAPADIDTDVTLDASASTVDPGGSVARYDWDLDEDGSFESTTAGPTRTGVRFTRSGQRIVRVRVTDDVGAVSVATKVVTVGNLAPTAAIGALPAWLASGRTTTLDGSGSADRDGSIATYQWDFDGDGTYDTLPLGAATTSYAFPAGSWTVRLRVVDDLGDATVTTRAVAATAPPQVSVAATPNPVRRGVPVQFSTAGSSDPDGTISAWAWDLDGNGSYETSGAAPTATYNAYGTVHVSARATDDHGVTTSTTFDLLVANPPPTAVLTSTTNPMRAGDAVTFDASASSDTEGPIAAYRWDLDGDGSFETNTATLPRVTSTFLNPGRVTVRVQVVDGDGGTATASLSLTVEAVGGVGGAGTNPGGDLGGGSAAPIDRVRFPGAGGGSTGGGATGEDAPGGVSGPLSAHLRGPVIQAVKRTVRDGVEFICSADRAAVCTVSLRLSAADARRLRLAPRGTTKPVLVGTATVVLHGSGEARLRVRLSAAAARRLRSARKLVLNATGTAVAGAGDVVALSRAVIVRR